MLCRKSPGILQEYSTALHERELKPSLSHFKLADKWCLEEPSSKPAMVKSTSLFYTNRLEFFDPSITNLSSWNEGKLFCYYEILNQENNSHSNNSRFPILFLFSNSKVRGGNGNKVM